MCSVERKSLRSEIRAKCRSELTSVRWDANRILTRNEQWRRECLPLNKGFRDVWCGACLFKRVLVMYTQLSAPINDVLQCSARNCHHLVGVVMSSFPP